MTFVVIFATLLLQGATLLPLVRWLRVGQPGREARDERRARKHAANAGVRAIRGELHRTAIPSERADELLLRVRRGSIGIAHSAECSGIPGERELLLAALQAQRAAIDRMRDAGQLGEALAERLATELDVDEMGVSGKGGRLTSAGPGG